MVHLARSSALLVALVAAAALSPSIVDAQTVRFTTSVGAFDMLLNPTNNPNLQAHVDNMLANVAAGVYHYSVVNRAANNRDGSPFVLQIGSFKTSSVDVSEVPINGWEATDAFSPVVVDANNDGNVDFSTAGLTNTRGTVSLALSAGNANSGAASFFVNLGSNTFLDNQDFVPFATIADMATIDRIMALEQIDLSQEVGQRGSLAFIDVPLTSDNELVVIETAKVISPSNVRFDGPLLDALGITPPVNSVPQVVAAATPSALVAGPTSLTSGSNPLAIPEPSAVCLVAVGVGLPIVRSGRRR
jgi:cyclophilin family peptidyl-prolyl cis-trans isomerase